MGRSRLRLVSHSTTQKPILSKRNLCEGTFCGRNVIQENSLIVTAHPEFLDAGLAEIRHFDKGLTSVELLAPGIALCAAPDIPTLMRLSAEQHPIFVRHIAPLQAIVPLSNTEQDIAKLSLAIVSLPTFE